MTNILGFEEHRERGIELVRKLVTTIHTTLTNARVRWPCTDYDQRERVRFCAKWVKEMLHDQKWSMHRVIDELPRRVEFHLEGIPWTPDGVLSWARVVPKDRRGLEVELTRANCAPLDEALGNDSR
jgi:hypothetical protein